jgi:hypothetical protein
MSKFLPTKSENPMELANIAQKIKYHEYIKCQEIAINVLDNIISKGLILSRIHPWDWKRGWTKAISILIHFQFQI